MNLDKLNELKDLDVEQLTALIREHQITLIKFVLIIGSVMMAGMMFNANRVKSLGLNAEMTDAQQKIDVIKARDVALGNINDFKSSIQNNLTESELITLISKYAKLHDVTILSLTPGDSKDMGLYDLIYVSFEASSDNFKNILLFLQNIENSKFPLRVDSWSGQEDTKGQINFGIKISAVFIHT